MKKLLSVSMAFGLVWAASFDVPASLVLPVSLERQYETADAVFVANVLGSTSFQPDGAGAIHTATFLKVGEVFKGTLPAAVKVIHRGGFLDGRGEVDDAAPAFKTGEQRLLFVTKRADGTVRAQMGPASAILLNPAGASASQLTPSASPLAELRNFASSRSLPGADLRDQAASAAEISALSIRKNATGPRRTVYSGVTNLFTASDGLSARFLGPDRGEPIPYLVDADYLPAGITRTAALSAVQNALAAWANASSLKFTFRGFQSFGMPAANVSGQDGVLRIQLHDIYGFISGMGEVLGRGGNSWAMSTTTAGWTLGGNVKGNDFHKNVSGWVVLQHNNSRMQSLANFTEVLCHELGHALSLDHSSTNPNEPNPLLNQAIMYHTAHMDGRGAAINACDIAMIRQVHPQDNTPPYTYDRFIEAVTTSPVIPGLNSIRMAGYDLQGGNLLLQTSGATSASGVFQVSGLDVAYNPNDLYQGDRLDPAGGSYYDLLYARFSDGVNASPYVMVRVIAFYPDRYNEGIPDAWRTTWFGNANPAAGPGRHANQDFDGDGFTNLQEYKLGSDPTSSASNLRLAASLNGDLRWPAKPYELYEIQGSTDLQQWFRAANPVMPTSTVAVVTAPTNGLPNILFRVVKLP